MMDPGSVDAQRRWFAELGVEVVTHEQMDGCWMAVGKGLGGRVFASSGLTEAGACQNLRVRWGSAMRVDWLSAQASGTFGVVHEAGVGCGGCGG